MKKKFFDALALGLGWGNVMQKTPHPNPLPKGEGTVNDVA